MNPPVYAWLNNTSVTSITGNRIYYGLAPQPTIEPYITWHVISGLPANSLDCVPDIGRMRVQIDCWATDKTTLLNMAKSARDSLEPHGYMVGQRGITFDGDLHRYQMDFSFWASR